MNERCFLQRGHLFSIAFITEKQGKLKPLEKRVDNLKAVETGYENYAKQLYESPEYQLPEP